jgi:hypothetical protein
MKKGVTPALFVIYALIAAGVLTGIPSGLALAQHQGLTKFTPGDLPYGIMRAGEAIIGFVHPNKVAWHEECMAQREIEREYCRQKTGCDTQKMDEEVEKQRMLCMEFGCNFEQVQRQIRRRIGTPEGVPERERGGPPG